MSAAQVTPRKVVYNDDCDVIYGALLCTIMTPKTAQAPLLIRHARVVSSPGQAQLESKVSRLEAQLEATVKQSDHAVAKERARNQMLAIDRGTDEVVKAALEVKVTELESQLEFANRRAAELQAGLRLGAALASKSRSGSRSGSAVVSPLISPVSESPLSPGAGLEHLQESLVAATRDLAAIEAKQTLT